MQDDAPQSDRPPESGSQPPVERESRESRSGESAPRKPPTRWELQLLYLKIWAPFLLNPHERRKIVVFKSRYEREGLRWTARFPKHCWECETTEDLEPRTFKLTLRSYEFPLHIVAGGCLALLFLGFGWLLFLGTWTTLILALLIVAVSGLLIRVKSWPEEVKLTIWSCPQHAQALVRPPIVVDDDQLHVFAPSDEVADAANMALEAERRMKRRGPEAGTPMYDGTMESVQRSNSQTSPGGESAETPNQPPAGFKKPALPPIKFDDEGQ